MKAFHKDIPFMAEFSKVSHSLHVVHVVDPCVNFHLQQEASLMRVSEAVVLVYQYVLGCHFNAIFIWQKNSNRFSTRVDDLPNIPSLTVPISWRGL